MTASLPSLSLVTATRDRAEILSRMALPSLLAQTDPDFSWVVVNDGGDPETSRLIDGLRDPRVRRLDMAHPEEGFAPCFARNLGVEAATGEIVAYIDDDNALEPGFVARVKADFAADPALMAQIPRQRRRRVAYLAEGPKIGAEFLSPAEGHGLAEFVTQEALFDSNGFAHRRQGAPRWNPAWRIYSDYEYFLRALEAWPQGFGIAAEVDVLYIQTSDGIIGRSSYRDWAEELDRLIAESAAYPALTPHLEAVTRLAGRYRQRAENAETPAAFAPPKG